MLGSLPAWPWRGHAPTPEATWTSRSPPDRSPESRSTSDGLGHRTQPAPAAGKPGPRAAELDVALKARGRNHPASRAHNSSRPTEVRRWSRSASQLSAEKSSTRTIGPKLQPANGAPHAAPERSVLATGHLIEVKVGCRRPANNSGLSSQLGPWKTPELAMPVAAAAPAWASGSSCSLQP